MEKKPIRPWTEDEIALLGTAVDREIAKRVGRTPGAVQRKRYQLVIPSFTPSASRKAKRDWTPEETSVLGTDTDAEVAKKIQRPISSVQAKRESLGIPAYRKATKRIVPPRASLTRPWTPEEESLLGTDSDEVIASILGRSVPSVGIRRRMLGIAHRPKKRRARRRNAWKEEEDALIGTIPDLELSRTTGRSLASINARRLALNAPRYIDPETKSPPIYVQISKTTKDMLTKIIILVDGLEGDQNAVEYCVDAIFHYLTSRFLEKKYSSD